MSCPEVVYQAYYPYLYQRPSTSSTSAARTAPFPPFSHQYHERVQRSLEQPSTSSEPVYLHHHASSHHSSAGSVSSGGGGVGSPGSPPPPPSARHKEEDASPSVEGGGASGSGTSGVGGGGQGGGDDEGESERSTAQYVSTNCVVFTHYTGDVAAVVDEHFSRALSCAASAAAAGQDAKNSSSTSAKESSPMSTRNFPASFWNSNYQGGSMGAHHGDLYGDPMYHGASSADPWHYQQYSAHHHRTVHEYHHHHHHNMAQYSGLLLPPTSRLPPHVTAPHQYHSKPGVEPWTSSQHHRLHHEPAASHHSLDSATPSYAPYPSMADQGTSWSRDGVYGVMQSSFQTF